MKEIMNCLAIWTPGAPEIIIVLVLFLLLFGGKKLPELARGLGRGIRLFKKELKGVQDELETPDESDDDQPSKPAGGPPSQNQ